MDEIKENNFLNKLNILSKEVFFKCLNILNNESNVKIAFYNFLFGDLITLDSNIAPHAIRLKISLLLKYKQ